MEFKPFAPPPTISHPLNTGLSTENGTNAHDLVEGINGYFQHLFSEVKASAAKMVEAIDSDARAAISKVEEDAASFKAEMAGKIAALESEVKSLRNVPPAEAPPAQPVVTGAAATGAASTVTAEQPPAPEVKPDPAPEPAETAQAPAPEPAPAAPAATVTTTETTTETTAQTVTAAEAPAPETAATVTTAAPEEAKPETDPAQPAAGLQAALSQATETHG